MIVLGIETSTAQVSCALGGHEGILASFQSTHGRRHAEALVPAIRFLGEQAKMNIREVSLVAVDIGPGLFTGLRVGVATAKAVAQALRVPMVGLCSLDLLAFPVRFARRLIVPVIDARRGEVFYAMYRPVPGGVQRISQPEVGSPEDLASELLARGDDCLLVGDGAIRYWDHFDDDKSRLELGGVTNAHPSAYSLVALAHARALREEFVQPWELQPMYLRKSDAELNWESRESA